MKLIIMCGLPFSGKTTLSKQIANHTNSKRISFDELWLELESNSTNISWSFVISEAKKRIIEYLNAGESVIYDDTNVRKEYRDSLVNLAKDCQVKSKIVYLNTPKELVIKRRGENLTNKARHDVEDDNFNSVFDHFEKPGQDEDVIVFGIDDEIDGWLKANFTK